MLVKNYPELNGHSVGILLKELVRRAIMVVRQQTTIFEVSQKVGYDGNMNDVFTTADRLAQQVYVKSLQECFPDVGIIGEEDSLMIPSAKGVDAYFTIDPIDGTKAYIRRQSHGVGSMIAFVVSDAVVSAYIGDINTREIFGYRPDSAHVWRITDMEVFEALDSNPPEVDIYTLQILMRDREQDYGELSQRTVNFFRGLSIDSGSIGIWAARLWKKEVGALVLRAAWETPWDSNPVIGISQKLGYTFLRPTVEGLWGEYPLIPFREKEWREHDMLIIHRNQLPSLARHGLFA